MCTVVDIQHHTFLNGTRGKSMNIYIPATCPYYCIKRIIYLFNRSTKLTLHFWCPIHYSDWVTGWTIEGHFFDSLQEILLFSTRNRSNICGIHQASWQPCEVLIPGKKSDRASIYPFYCCSYKRMEIHLHSPTSFYNMLINSAPTHNLNSTFPTTCVQPQQFLQ